MFSILFLSSSVIKKNITKFPSFFFKKIMLGFELNQCKLMWLCNMIFSFQKLLIDCTFQGSLNCWAAILFETFKLILRWFQMKRITIIRNICRIFQKQQPATASSTSCYWTENHLVSLFANELTFYLVKQSSCISCELSFIK